MPKTPDTAKTAPATTPHPGWYRLHNPDTPGNEYTITRHNVDT